MTNRGGDASVPITRLALRNSCFVPYPVTPHFSTLHAGELLETRPPFGLERPESPGEAVPGEVDVWALASVWAIEAAELVRPDRERPVGEPVRARREIRRDVEPELPVGPVVVLRPLDDRKRTR